MSLSYLFTVPETEKVTDHHFRRVLIANVIGILLSMACLVSTTWLLFATIQVS